ncbi:MAG: hypothetical protein COT74_05930 [Bdellovibrionales bacterium CG10_big_fil_rev_8_21_14_0_10_45_34]|nr:MAG: hypothetical protein COT74_05930 [Bdellovibrionales bacterium CG10_big_fil_rev_8_21_14_0_10_45_34]
MKSNIYEYRDYKSCLVDLLEAGESSGRGKRKQLADFIGCQVSHISNVTSGSGHFNQEQAEAAARFFGLNNYETEFFLLLIQFERAGTAALKSFIERQLDHRQKKFTTLKRRLKIPESLPAEAEALYYSSWHYGAVHILLSVQQLQTRELIASKLEIPQTKVDEILSFLTQSGICKKEGQRYQLIRPLLHLDKSSPHIIRHHSNWRLKSLLSLDRMNENDLRYSAAFTLSQKDYSYVKERLTKALSEIFETIKVSDEEDAAVICLDLFKL